MTKVARKPLKLIHTVWRFYFEGFRNQKGWSRQVWIIILVKLFIMFFVLKFFFFPNFLNTNYTNDQERSNPVIEQLINPKK
jgi:hypothetical protein